MPATPPAPRLYRGGVGSGRGRPVAGACGRVGVGGRPRRRRVRAFVWAARHRAPPAPCPRLARSGSVREGDRGVAFSAAPGHRPEALGFSCPSATARRGRARRRRRRQWPRPRPRRGRGRCPRGGPRPHRRWTAGRGSRRTRGGGPEGHTSNMRALRASSLRMSAGSSAVGRKLSMRIHSDRAPEATQLATASVLCVQTPAEWH